MDQLQQIRDYLLNEKLIQSISHTHLMKKYNLNKDEAREVCITLQNEGILQSIYDIICPNCFRLLGTYETFDSIPQESECIYCNGDAVKLNDSYIRFKVVR